MRKRILNIKGRRIILCWMSKMIHNDREAKEQAMDVVATVPNNSTYWGGFGRGPLLVIIEC